MPTSSKGGATMRYDANNPADFAYIVDSGIIWNGPPPEQQRAIDMLTNGELPINEKTVPPEVLRYLTSQQTKAVPQ